MPLTHNRFAGVFFIATFGRGILLSVLPLQAFAILGDAQRVSVFYFLVSSAGICSSLSVPAIVRWLGNYRAFCLSLMAMGVSVPLLLQHHVAVFAMGMFMHVFAIAAGEVTLNLYILDRIPRVELGRFEPKRIFAVVLAMSIGPWLGVYLSERLAPWAPFGVTLASTLAALVYFRALGLHRVTLRPSSGRTVNPLHHLRRFFSQPRLTLAWLLVCARSSWWAMFVIYTPIYTASTGLGDLVGAAIVSVGSAWTVTVTFWGRVGRRFGLRRLLISGYCATAALTALVFVCSERPGLATGLLLLAALGATVLDGAGNVPFLRAVRPWERSEMTGVFLTYRDASQLATPGLFAVLLQFHALPVIFVGAATWMLASALLARHIPRRM